MPETTKPRVETIVETVGLGVMFAGWVVVIGVTGFILLFQSLHWLKLGEWPDWSPMALGFMPPVTHLRGVNKILAWLYDQQLAVLSVIAGVALMGLGAWITASGEQAQRT